MRSEDTKGEESFSVGTVLYMIDPGNKSCDERNEVQIIISVTIDGESREVRISRSGRTLPKSNGNLACLGERKQSQLSPML